MSGLYKRVLEDYTDISGISKERYYKMKAELSESDFNLRFLKNVMVGYKKLEYAERIAPKDESELTPYLLFRLLQVQEYANNKLDTISLIMKFSLINFVVAAIVAAIVIF